MWRFIEGVKKPEKAEKRPRPSTSTTTEDDEEKSAGKRAAKRAVTFNQVWLKEFSWLTYDSESGEMHCQVCNENGGDPLSGRSNRGSTNYKHYTLERHQFRGKHREVVRRAEIKS